jgi:hypothetical protein
MSLSKHKLVRAVTAEELDSFLESLAGMTDVTGAKIRELAESRFGVEMGHDAANNFRKDVFGRYIERMRKRKELSATIAAHRDNDNGRTLADAASEELQQQVFEFLADNAPLDLSNDDDLARAEALARIIKGARSEDRKMIDDLRAQLKEAQEREKATAKAVVSAAEGRGASPELVGAIREAMQFRPKAETLKTETLKPEEVQL